MNPVFEYFNQPRSAEKVQASKCMICRLKTDQTEASNIVLGMFAEEMIPRAKQILAGVGLCLSVQLIHVDCH
jgi:hypothetical protein